MAALNSFNYFCPKRLLHYQKKHRVLSRTTPISLRPMRSKSIIYTLTPPRRFEIIDYWHVISLHAANIYLKHILEQESECRDVTFEIYVISFFYGLFIPWEVLQYVCSRKFTTEICETSYFILILRTVIRNTWHSHCSSSLVDTVGLCRGEQTIGSLLYETVILTTPFSNYCCRILQFGNVVLQWWFLLLEAPSPHTRVSQILWKFSRYLL